MAILYPPSLPQPTSLITAGCDPTILTKLAGRVAELPAVVVRDLHLLERIRGQRFSLWLSHQPCRASRRSPQKPWPSKSDCYRNW
jgi:hypothetical protein